MNAVTLAVLLTLAAPVSAQTISGRVIDATTLDPLAARVEVAGGRQVTTAAADGGFRVDALGAARLTLVVSCPGYYVQRLTVEVARAGPVEVALAPVVSVTDRIEVTATRAREGVDPVSFTNVPQERVADAYWGQDPAVLLSQVVPGLYATNDNGNGIGYSSFAIRGFGQARTRVTLNGAPMNDAESGDLYFVDLADFMATAGDVQVRRGVFGLSGLGGSIDISTAQPSPTPGFSVEAGAGSYATRRFSVQAQSGLVGGRWAFAARYSTIATDGYRDQSWVDMWNYYASAARFGERSRLRLVFFGGPEKTHLAYVGVPRAALEGRVTGDADRDRRANPLAWDGEIDRFLQPHYQLVHEFQWSPATRISQTAYVFTGAGHYDQYRARRWLYEYALPDQALPDGTILSRSDLVRRRSVAERDAGWVPTVTHGRGRWTFELQGEVRLHRAHHDGEVRWADRLPALPPGHRYYDYRVDKRTASVAGEARVELTPRVSLSGGLQATHHGYDLSRDRLKGVSLSEDFNFVLPRAGAIVKLSDSDHAYLGVARGMREPFFRSIYDPQDYYAAPASLAPEDVWNVEAGISAQRARWRARGNVFWMKFLNEIVYAGALDDNGVPVYGNGARSRRLGAELDAGVTIVPGLALDGALTLSRNTFTRYREFGFDGGSVVYDGHRVAGFPGVMASVAARGEWRGARGTLSVRHVGRFYLDNTQREDRVNDAFTVADAAVTLPVPAAWTGGGRGRLALDLRVNNLFDARYTSFGYVDGEALYIPAAGRNVFGALSVRF